MVTIFTQIRTDLALEAAACQSDRSGILRSEETADGITVTRLEIQTEEAAARCQKPKGIYITLELPKLWSYDFRTFSECVRLAGRELGALLSLSPQDLVLVAGLGNERITPDALGPFAVKNTMITRHLKDQLPQWFASACLRPVCAVCPNVLGNTGIEALRIIRGICQTVKPAAVIVLDALAARGLPRLAATLQISDAGIVPGSGVGNAREEISQKTLGIPVLSMGIPMVVDAATLASDVVDRTFALLETQSGVKDPSLLGSIGPEDKTQLFAEVLAPDEMNLFVTPKDVDRMAAELGKLLGFAVNCALHSDVSIDDMAKFTAV